MIILRLLTVLALVMTASCQTVDIADPCWAHVSESAAGSFAEHLEIEIEAFQSLVEESLVFRSEMLKTARELQAKPDRPLTGRQLEVLSRGSADYLSVRHHLYAVAERYECLVDADAFDTALSIDKRSKIKATMLSLAAALTLYDNYLLAIIVYEEDERLRRLINDPDSGFGVEARQLDDVTTSANSVAKRNRIRRGIKLFERLVSESGYGGVDAQAGYLRTLILQSPSYNFTKKIQIGEIASRKYRFLERVSSDFVSEMTNGSVNLVSEMFGNTVGLYEDRKGKLHDDKRVAREIRSILQPGDILLEKTPFRLTDRFIPGHFGHVAIWIGDKEALQGYGLWNHHAVLKHQERILAGAGHNIVEALRPGVQLSTLEEFMNVDDVAVLRPIALDRKGMKEALLLALRQVGKEYDFNFDVNTTEKIVCSELAYVSYPTIDWPTEQTIGRHTISPDQVAKQALDESPLKLITFYHDGRKVRVDAQLALYKRLMEEEEEEE
jgi:uncharacterized protein YycO